MAWAYLTGNDKEFGNAFWVGGIAELERGEAGEYRVRCGVTGDVLLWPGPKEPFVHPA